jgi:chemotaxis protein methyltransferase WspC
MQYTTEQMPAEILRLLRQRGGIDPDLFGIHGILHAIDKRAAAIGAASLQDYLDRLKSDEAEFQDLLEDLLVPETWMFRDALAFRSLKRYLDTSLSNRRRPLRALSVACSTGEEVYSLAIAFRESGFDPSQFQIVGADLCNRSLETARRGELNPRSFRGPEDENAAIRDRWCERDGPGWRIREDLHKGVDFVQGNLAQTDFLANEPTFEIVFCRNVLIYFHAEARRTAVENLRRLLSPEGVLYCSPAEARILSDTGFVGFDSDCPFAFRCPGTFAEPVPAASIGADGGLHKSAESWHEIHSVWPDMSAKGVVKPVAQIERPASELPQTGTGYALSAQKDTSDILDTARQAANDGRLEEAESLCAAILSSDPANIEAHYLRGVVLQARGMAAEAQRSLEKVLYLDPRHYQALVHMMLLSEQRGDQAATANYRRRAGQAAPTEAK